MTNDNWETPEWLLNHFKGHYDPCPKIPEWNGLKADWISPAFVNPPYSNPLSWVKKAITESKKGVKIVMLLRVDVSTKWYKLLIENNAHFSYFNERIRFKGSKNSPNFCNMLVFL